MFFRLCFDFILYEVEAACQHDQGQSSSWQIFEEDDVRGGCCCIQFHAGMLLGFSVGLIYVQKEVFIEVRLRHVFDAFRKPQRRFLWLMLLFCRILGMWAFKFKKDSGMAMRQGLMRLYQRRMQSQSSSCLSAEVVQDSIKVAGDNEVPGEVEVGNSVLLTIPNKSSRRSHK